MKSYNNISLLPFNSFGIDVNAKRFVEFSEKHELVEFIKSGALKSDYYILGGGSNILFTKDFEGTIIHPNLKGISVIEENNISATIRVNAGEVWDQFVEFCVNQNFGGLENLSLIPGHCGAAPVQNIGAFGVEIKDHLFEVEITNLETGESKTISSINCEFGYRSSIFKTTLKHKWIITSTVYKLTKSKHVFNTNYGNIKDELSRFQETNLKSIRQAVINIRTSKLPDPKEKGNAGSFFKNPVVTNERAEELKKTFPDVPLYPFTAAETKVAAGWLIDNCGWKGKKLNDAGVHEKQALVIVNHGKAKSEDIIQLAENIKSSVLQKFMIQLETEVNYV
jgi:UDP-N-acetylmuramate dehydrogenase